MAELTIKEAYEAVFNEDGTLKTCGRDACIKLISACKAKDQETYFGNEENGQICLGNFPRIWELYSSEK